MVKGLFLYPLQAGEKPDRIAKPCNEVHAMYSSFSIFRQLIDLSGQTPPGAEEIKSKPRLTVYWLPEGSKPKLLGMGERDTDDYGRRLTFIRAYEFRRLEVPESTDDSNKQIVARLSSLPEATPIILYWV
jgi:hypothetical protein